MKLAAKPKKDNEYKCQVRSHKVDELKSQEPKIAGDAVASSDSVLGPFHGFWYFKVHQVLIVR